ncbi:hypothetical protein TD95_003010 [Thielaviopsis punctulata]|uniref:RNA exonuclease 4 n=1 Tax=Thielaviopsis punctulata TaxID=72032 RepID=A0A0F4ZCK2_9PEZI|nr:hypothetical protein TD95_003010 [Thielaviopsis punctulata]
MAGLSSNWKKLQAQMKAGAQTSTPSSSPSTKSTKRKISDPATHPSDRPSKKAKSQSASSSKPAAKATPKSHPARAMGSVQSKVDSTVAPGVSPSSALWSRTSKINSDDLAAAYRLSANTDFQLCHPADKENAGRTPNLALGKYIAIDCEMVGVGPNKESALARLSLVDFHGRQIYDSYVKPKGRVTEWRTPISGIEPRHIRMARTFEEVQAAAAEIFKDRILVGHDIAHDLSALELSHPAKDIRDTAKTPQFKKYGNGRKPALRVLVRQLLKTEIQTGAHSSVEDARATMELFRRYKPGFDADIASRYGGGKPKPKSKSKRR